jgi:hypothetical protein
MNVGSETEPVIADLWEIVGNSHNEGTNITSGKLTAATDETAVKLTVKATYNGESATAAVKVVATPHNPSETGSIKEKFSITTGTTDAVTETFNLLHEFIKGGGLTNDKTNNLIALGDWIDLEGGLEVSPYGVYEKFLNDNAGGNSLDDENRGKISLQYNAGDTTQLLRLIVVGINSFRSDGTYKKTENDGVDHLVFQFKNIPGIHIMNQGQENNSTNPSNNTGGYAASEMRKYLAPVIEDEVEVEGSGNFLAGLVNAGVPKDVLWGPTRYVSTVGYNNTVDDVTTINDLLWLPTRFEMTGSSQAAISPSGVTEMLAENDTNQVRLKYYTEGDNNGRKKSKQDGSFLAYWLSSAAPFNNSLRGFAIINTSGTAPVNSASTTRNGVVPAFCVR